MSCKLKEIRTELRYTQTLLAAESGVSRETINAIENGRAGSVSTKTLENISKVLGKSVAEIFFAEDV